MQTTFAVLGHLSKAKGRVTEEDIQLANHLMSHMQLDDTGRRLAQEAFNRGKQTDFPIRQVIREFRLGCGQRGDLLRAFFIGSTPSSLFWRTIAWYEKSVLFVVAEELGLSRVQFEQMLAMEMAARQFTRGGFYQQGGYYQQQHSGYQGGYQHQSQQSSSGPTLDDAYKVLGVTAADDQPTVKRAYRRLMNENHPDKLVAKGLPPEWWKWRKKKRSKFKQRTI